MNILTQLFHRISDELALRSGSPGVPPAAQLREQWRRDGFVLLDGLFSAAECDRVLTEVERYASARRHTLGTLSTVDVLHGAYAGKRLRIADAPDEVFAGPFKLNNLIAESPVIQSLTFARPLLRVLRLLLGSEPMAINSLNFRFGSQQPDHIDSWYMPPPRPNSMVVASVCLEDTDPEAGPLVYYPGSHAIPPYVFSHGRLDAVDEEMSGCTAYVEREVASRGLQRRVVLGRKGDVFIWHCQLLHGGSPIVAPEKTRASLVTHYWGSNCVKRKRITRGLNGGRILIRDYAFASGEGVTEA